MWKKRLWRIFGPLLMMILACGVQTVIWPNLIPLLVAPPFWILLMVWISLYRDGKETILLLYLMGWIATAFTAMPIKMMLFSILILHFLIRRVKERVFWPGLPYFVMFGTAAVAAFQVIYILLSAILEPTRVAWLPLERLTLILWAAPTSILMYGIMSKVDRPAPLITGNHHEGSYV